MATVAEIKANILERLSAASAELAASADTDTNEYVLRRYDEFLKAIELLARIETLEGTESDDLPGPYEIITQGET